MRQQKRAKLAARTKLSFAQDEDEEDEEAEQTGAAKVIVSQHDCVPT